jgi:hypothetical protein
MFYIRDCNDTIVGNPAGYRTIRGAAAQQNNPRSKAYHAIRAAYDAREAWYQASCMPMQLRRRNLCSIRLQGDE